MSKIPIKDGKTVLLDTVVLIYFLENHERYGALAESCLKRIELGEIRGIISSLVFAELLVPLYKSDDKVAASGLVSRLTGFRNLTIHDLDAETSATAARLRAKYGLRTPDAIHAATALTAGGDGILTNDRQLRRLEKEKLTIWLFDDLV
jgi:predicted nucleic acid-binding protein